jgi:hypothetical protein
MLHSSFQKTETLAQLCHINLEKFLKFQSKYYLVIFVAAESVHAKNELSRFRRNGFHNTIQNE